MNDDAKTPWEQLQEQLTIVEDRVRGVALGHSAGFYCCGRAGVAKTYTVRTTLDAIAAATGKPYKYANGYITGPGLFELIDTYSDRTIVLDDMGEIFKNNVAMQLLLAALGNQPTDTGTRRVTYRTKQGERTTLFRGGLVCISNLQLRDTPHGEAIKSRIHCLNYNPTEEQIAALFLKIAENGFSRGGLVLTAEEATEVAEFVIKQSKELGFRLDVRLLVDKAFPDYAQHRARDAKTHWQDLIRATLHQQQIELTHKPGKLRRLDHKHSEQELVRRFWRTTPATKNSWRHGSLRPARVGRRSTGGRQK